MRFEARGRWVRLPFEVREDGDEFRVQGYAAVFDQEADIAGLFRERIAPGAFREAIGRDDVLFNFNHDDATVMARTSSGTLKLAEDDRGLRIEASLATDDPDVQRIRSKMRRGDLDKMSFAFFSDREEWDDTGETPVRTIRQASLHDVSVVTTPAYAGTEIGERMLAEARAAARRRNFRAAASRLRMKRDLAVRENGWGR